MWEYYDKSKKYHKLGPITPLAFYQQHVKPYFNMEDKVCGYFGTLRYEKMAAIHCYPATRESRPTYFLHLNVLVIDLITSLTRNSLHSWNVCFGSHCVV